MSYSVSNLFKAMAMNPKMPETQMSNPDIPDFSSAVKNRDFIKDQAYNCLKLSTGPRNGDGDLLPRNSFRPDNPKLDAFMMDRAIDPDVIRQRVDPTTLAQPVWNQEGMTYGIDSTMSNSHNNVPLIQQARNSYYNYTNRFNVQNNNAYTPPTGDNNGRISSPTVTGMNGPPPPYSKPSQSIPIPTQTIPIPTGKSAMEPIQIVTSKPKGDVVDRLM
jgi:hypothetical protein